MLNYGNKLLDYSEFGINPYSTIGNYINAGTNTYGCNIVPSMTSYDSYKYAGVSGQESSVNGVVKRVSAYFSNSGTCHICTAKYDETHKYIYEYEETSFEVEQGLHTYEINLPIKIGETLLVKPSEGVGIMVIGNTGDKPGNWIPGIFSDGDINVGIFTNVTTYLLWDVYNDAVSTSEELDSINKEISNNIANITSDIANIESKIGVVTDEDGNSYKLIVVNGELSVRPLLPKNILVLSHSFGAIVEDSVGGWQRGMSSTRVSTDWVSRIMSVLSPSGVIRRIKMVDWETSFPSPSSKLSTLLTDEAFNGIDSIFIMIGANVNQSYQTYDIAVSNFTELINYCKNKLPNANIYVCSPGYTGESFQFNKGIAEAARSTGCPYISTYCTYNDRFASYGDIVESAGTEEYIIIDSEGRVTHPNDIWHLYMANRILSYLGKNELNILHNITVNQTDIEYRTYTRWAEGGIVTLCTFDENKPTITVKTSSGVLIESEVIDIRDHAWNTIPSKIPKYSCHFIMPNDDVIISII